MGTEGPARAVPVGAHAGWARGEAAAISSPRHRPGAAFPGAHPQMRKKAQKGSPCSGGQSPFPPLIPPPLTPFRARDGALGPELSRRPIIELLSKWQWPPRAAPPGTPGTSQRQDQPSPSQAPRGEGGRGRRGEAKALEEGATRTGTDEVAGSAWRGPHGHVTTTAVTAGTALRRAGATPCVARRVPGSSLQGGRQSPSSLMRETQAPEK